MKFLYKGVLVASLAVCMTSATAFATETGETPPSKENIRFNYATNMFDIDAGTEAATGVELTVMLVKGDLTGEDVSLSQISIGDVYYVGQKTGKNYDVFDGLGVKYDTNAFAPGVYTLITSGENVGVKKTKLVIGNAINKDASLSSYLPNDWIASEYTFGSVGQTIRYYPEVENGNYIYVCFADFPAITDFANAGFIFQNISNTPGTATKYLVKPLGDFNMNKALEGIRSTNANIRIGVQVNDVPVVASGNIEAVDNIVAIPYVKN